ncbi:MAG: hypothetical protein KAR44_00105 [Candidatus Aegiribacteria sp.]|nr:hypothetical protein [Candidatus Aegiribacteria sp.]
MSRLFLVLAMIIGLAFFGCGEQADEAGNGVDGDNGEVTQDGNGDDSGEAGDDAGDDIGEDDTGDQTVASLGGFDLDSPEMAVGQWIEYGADDMSETLTISVVGAEVNQGTECYWVQISVSDFVAQMLIDAEGMESAMGEYEEQLGEFAADPAAYIRENMSDASSMADMFGNEENMDMALEFISAIRIVKFEQQGMIMAIDLIGVPEFLEEVMEDPAFQEQFEQGFEQGFNADGGQEGLDDILAELDNLQFGITETSVDVAGNRIQGIEFSVTHPEGEIEAVICSELPLVPLAYASATGDGETHFIEVRGYGFSGAQNLLPGEPAQTLQAMMFLEGMMSQMGAMGADQGRGVN